MYFMHVTKLPDVCSFYSPSEVYQDLWSDICERKNCLIHIVSPSFYELECIFPTNIFPDRCPRNFCIFQGKLKDSCLEGRIYTSGDKDVTHWVVWCQSVLNREIIVNQFFCCCSWKQKVICMYSKYYPLKRILQAVPRYLIHCGC